MTAGSRPPQHDTGETPSGGSPTARARIIRRRRRRAGAILAVAFISLACGAVIGTGARRRGSVVRHAHAQPAALLRGQPLQRLTLLAREALAIERTRRRVPIVRTAGAQHREIALTFDDGPGPYTPAVLRILTREHVPATFFEVGQELRYFSASTTAVVRLGDAVGDHTWSHPDMAQLPRRAQRMQILRQAAAIGNDGAPFPQMYRPPFGRWNDTTLRLLRESHMLMVLWSVDTDDWERPGVRQIIRNALAGARPGAIILLHDAGGDRSQTVKALPRIIHALTGRGYRLVTVPRLLLDNPPPRDQDVGSVRGQGG